MRRFRYTLLSICLVLLFLGGSDLILWFNNQNAEAIGIDNLEQKGAPREWLKVSDGYQDLDRAISTSGSVKMEALLVPLLTNPEQEEIRVLVETRNPHLLQLFQEYHFLSDTIPDKEAFRSKFAAEFKGQREVTGMLVAGLVARGNQQNLLKLAKETELRIADDVIFISEGKEPDRLRGVFFTLIGLLGLIKLLFGKKDSTAVSPGKPQ